MKEAGSNADLSGSKPACHAGLFKRHKSRQDRSQAQHKTTLQVGAKHSTTHLREEGYVEQLWLKDTLPVDWILTQAMVCNKSLALLTFSALIFFPDWQVWLPVPLIELILHYPLVLLSPNPSHQERQTAGTEPRGIMNSSLGSRICHFST